MTKRPQCKDIPTAPILEFLAKPGMRGTWFPGFDNSVQNAMPEGTPAKLALAKMGTLIRRGLVDGCTDGCRGDFQLAPDIAAGDTPHYGSTIRATFNPARTDDLQPGVADWIGKSVVLRFIGYVDWENPYQGQAQWMPLGDGLGPVAWVPQCDLSEIRNAGPRP